MYPLERGKCKNHDVEGRKKVEKYITVKYYLWKLLKPPKPFLSPPGKCPLFFMTQLTYCPPLKSWTRLLCRIAVPPPWLAATHSSTSPLHVHPLWMMVSCFPLVSCTKPWAPEGQRLVCILVFTFGTDAQKFSKTKTPLRDTGAWSNCGNNWEQSKAGSLMLIGTVVFYCGQNAFWFMSSASL